MSAIDVDCDQLHPTHEAARAAMLERIAELSARRADALAMGGPERIARHHESGRLTAVAQLPWYLKSLEVSRPLHFGDFGGLPLKILWTLLDLVTIVVLATGLYLWLKRRRVPFEQQLADAEPEAGGGESAQEVIAIGPRSH